MAKLYGPRVLEHLKAPPGPTSAGATALLKFWRPRASPITKPSIPWATSQGECAIKWNAAGKYVARAERRQT